jgi:hypothetical protein
MVPDNVGNKDIFAVVVTKKPLEWYALNAAISKSTRSDYGGKIQEALQGTDITNIRFATGNGGTINFKADNEQKNAVICVVEVSK